MGQRLLKEAEAVEAARIARQNVPGSNRGVIAPIIQEVSEKQGPFRHIRGLFKKK